MVPTGKKSFKKNDDYKFKLKGGSLQGWHWQLWWTDKLTDIKRSDLTAGGPLITSSTQALKFTRKARGKYAFWTMVKPGANGNDTGPLEEWSPKGTPAPFRVKKDGDGLPGGEIMFIILFIVLMLLATWLWFLAAAPLDVLIEMNMEGPFNQYGIRRWETKKDENGNDIGYNYPNRQTTHDTQKMYYCSEFDSRPKYFNYMADGLVRIWARIMKIRHNGYFVHGTSYVTKSSLESDETKMKRLDFYNMTPAYNYGIYRLTNNNFKKVLKYYDPEEKIRESELNRFDPYTGKGARKHRIDTRKEGHKQTLEWDDKLQWFKPAIVYTPYTKK